MTEAQFLEEVEVKSNLIKDYLDELNGHLANKDGEAYDSLHSLMGVSFEVIQSVTHYLTTPDIQWDKD